MKRKLDENDNPSPAAPAGNPTEQAEPAELAEQAEPTEPADSDVSFADLGLDSRLLQAIAQQDYRIPTLVQRRAIPLALHGKDVLAKAKTGSGKTAAYVLPVLQSILKRKQVYICILAQFPYCRWPSLTLADRCERLHRRPHPGSHSRAGRPSPQSYRILCCLLRQGRPMRQADRQSLRRRPTVPPLELPRHCCLDTF